MESSLSYLVLLSDNRRLLTLRVLILYTDDGSGEGESTWTSRHLLRYAEVHLRYWCGSDVQALVDDYRNSRLMENRQLIQEAKLNDPGAEGTSQI